MSTRLLTVTSYLGYFLIGFLSIILATALSYMIEDFGLTLATAGAAYSTRAAGTLAGVFLGGILSDKLGRKPLIVVGCLLQGMAMAFIASSGSWIWVLLLFAVAGMAGGFVNSSLNALVAEIHTRHRGAAMNILHGIYGIGALTGPLAVGLVLMRYGWRMAYYAAAALWLLYMLITLPLPYPSTQPGETKGAKPKSLPVRSFAASPILMMLILVSFIYNGVANGLVGWINTYLGDLEFSALLGAGMITVFYTGLTAGRFACGFFSDRIGFPQTILICSLGSLLFYPVAVLAKLPLVITVGVFFSGFFFSGLHPTGLAYANTLFPHMAGTITGTLSASMSLGAMAIPWIIGIIADHAGFIPGFSIGIALIALLVAIALRLLRTKPGTLCAR